MKRVFCGAIKSVVTAPNLMQTMDIASSITGLVTGRNIRLHSKTNFVTSHILNMRGGDSKVCLSLDYVNTNLSYSNELIARHWSWLMWFLIFVE